MDAIISALQEHMGDEFEFFLQQMHKGEEELHRFNSDQTYREAVALEVEAAITRATTPPLG